MGYFANKRVLITGASGFIGSNFLSALIHRGADLTATKHHSPLQIASSGVRIVNADLTNLSDAIRCTKDIDHVVHCAGGITAAATTVGNPMAVLATNLVTTLRLLEASWMNGVKKFLIFSSGTTGYPPYDFPVRESDFWTDHPAKIYFGYGWSRRFNELMAEFVQTRSGMQIAICRPSAPYGKYDNFDEKTGHVIPALISRALKKENPFVVWGTGDESRDFIYADDFVRGCLELLEKKADCDPVNISYGLSSTIKQLVESILYHANHTTAELVFDSTKPTTIPTRKIDNTKAKNELGFSTEFSLDQGIAETINWYRSRSTSLQQL